ncbi:MAG: hypothetical protein QOH06_5122 [Acidobacteriota bacterium]|jgi:hypothetical protein|nr:hypothetical protein [Acidobacteriota bacterium]
MKVIGLLLGSFLLALVLAPASAQAQWCQGIDGPYWCGDPDACQAICSEPGSDCTTSCKRFGNTWATCGAGGGDNDADGVADDIDNCTCSANADQADCDEDGIGDACDSQNEKWVYVQDLGECDIDRHATGTEWDVQRMGAKRYRNVCNNTYCSDRYVIQEESCTFSFWGCGKGYIECCECQFGYDTCHQPSVCGEPNCPF